MDPYGSQEWHRPVAVFASPLTVKIFVDLYLLGTVVLRLDCTSRSDQRPDETKLLTEDDDDCSLPTTGVTATKLPHCELLLFHIYLLLCQQCFR
jgi:hypothetical protein